MKLKKLPDKYVYPAIFTDYGPGKEIAVEFPDLGVATSGVDDADALQSARELLGITMLGIEEDKEKAPSPSRLSSLKLEEGETSSLIDIYMPTLRLAHETRAVNRTVTLPAWLNAIALERNVNFSQVLQKALKEMLL
ncbi:MAG: type II toxin-antitoxin system HicB family antitoxin [Lachnospiraceae bacterium]|nr:type II toxin-antitoxin system HicB family antitoxin [Lachnospiraceae bacterium]MBP5264562.1 type II toxin-antitoxin system HicB family antitoxin [Lachnospiraceae bacterium]MBP5670227.1 type II toxin-antitoxin system HicB family antitoxin [Lachnospiraceae bacterium]MBR3470208.1 type II toxin-antitoxin system HicB family antitoxin [Lachnospiraceae bacterium]MCR5499080.1 type II toxin-antitoxin system HicB family antitoxin [Acetatifactor sp.]